MNRLPCMHCSRFFAMNRIEKHQQICGKLSSRNTFCEKSKSPQHSQVQLKFKHKLKLNYPNSKWQKQHLDLIKKLRNDESFGNYEEYITCPYCSRRFAPIPAEKHIIACKDIIHKPKPPPGKLNILPRIYEKLPIQVPERISSEFSKQSPKNLSFIGLKIEKNTERRNEKNDEAGITERLMRKDKKLIENSFEKGMSLIGRRKNKQKAEVRSKSIYKIVSNVCKCGEIFQSRAVYCMMCGNCKYR